MRLSDNYSMQNSGNLNLNPNFKGIYPKNAATIDMLNKLSQNDATKAEFQELFKRLDVLARNINLKIGDWGSAGVAVTKYDAVKNSTELISRDSNCMDAIKKAIDFLINGAQPAEEKITTHTTGLKFSIPKIENIAARQKKNPLSFCINPKAQATYLEWYLDINPAEMQLAEERLSNAAKKLKDTDIVVLPYHSNGAQVIEVENLCDSSTYGKTVDYLSADDSLLEALDKAAKKLEERFKNSTPRRRKSFPGRNSLDIKG